MAALPGGFGIQIPGVVLPLGPLDLQVAQAGLRRLDKAIGDADLQYAEQGQFACAAQERLPEDEDRNVHAFQRMLGQMGLDQVVGTVNDSQDGVPLETRPRVTAVAGQ